MILIKFLIAVAIMGFGLIQLPIVLIKNVTTAIAEGINTIIDELFKIGKF